MNGIKHVHAFIDRHGNTRCYYRPPGKRAVPLPADTTSAAFRRAYKAAVSGEPLKIPQTHHASRKTKRKKSDLVSAFITKPKVGVYILLLEGRIVYIGSSENMARRVLSHRTNGRDFDEVFYIGTKEDDRLRLETILIRAVKPRGNRTNGAKREPGFATRRQLLANLEAEPSENG